MRPVWCPLVEVKVRLFAMLRQRAGAPEVPLELPDGATVADALAALEGVRGGMTCVLAVNREYAPGDQVLRPGDEVALIPPVSGGAPPSHVAVTPDPLSLDALVALVQDPRAGAVVTFSGQTRDVAWLDYEAYEAMAVEQLQRIVDAAIDRHGLLACACWHRVGRVPLGEPSVLVAASSGHRPEAFAGAREVIDAVKASAAIWKAEEGAWVEGTLPPNAS